VVYAVQDGVLNVYQWKPAYRIEDFPAAPRPVQLSRAQAQPSLLLRARSQVVPFTGRKEDVRELTRWRDHEDVPGLGLRLLHGPGGQGKTRLAAHFAEQSRQAGWRVWQAGTNPPGTALASAAAQKSERGPGLLLVVDYAERWPVPALYELLHEPVLHAGRVRVLLLARPAGMWWASIAAWADRELDVDADTQALPPLVAKPEMRQHLFAEARDHFARHLCLPSEQAATVASPADLADNDQYAQVLTVHIAALAAVDTRRRGEEGPTDPARASAYLLRREREHWAELHRRLPEPLASNPLTMGRAVFTATFTGPLARPSARQALRSAELAETAELANTVLDDHAYCYPPAQAGTVLEPLYPDRLAEDFAALALSDPTSVNPAGDDWADHALSGLLPAPARQGDQVQVPPWTRPALTMLIETARRWPHVAATQLYPLLTARPELMLHADGAALAALAALPEIDLGLLERIEAVLPVHRHADLDVGIAALAERLADYRLAVTTDPAARARIHDELALRLSYAGLHADAVTEGLQALLIWRELAERNRDAYLPKLAASMGNYAAWVAEIGLRDEAVLISEGAVHLQWELARLSGNAYLPDLAASLNNYALRLNKVGRRDEAVLVSEDAVVLYRALAEQNRDVYLHDLAGSLNNYALRLAETGRRDEAARASEEAIGLRRELAERNRDAYLPDLAMSLNNHAARVAETGRRDEAVLISEEAVRLFGKLAEGNRDAYLPKLAASLSNHALRLAGAGRQDEAVQVSSEAVRLRRELVELNWNASLHSYVQSLSVLGLLLVESARFREAVAPLVEAAEAGQQLPEHARDVVRASVGLLSRAYSGDAAGVSQEFRALTGLNFPKGMKKLPEARGCGRAASALQGLISAVRKSLPFWTP
jgi:hypothetical protein